MKKIVSLILLVLSLSAYSQHRLGNGDWMAYFFGKHKIAPSITVQPTSVNVSQGANTSFSVTATGTAPITYQWQYFNGLTWSSVINFAPYSGATTATLTVTME